MEARSPGRRRKGSKPRSSNSARSASIKKVPLDVEPLVERIVTYCLSGLAIASVAVTFILAVLGVAS